LPLAGLRKLVHVLLHSQRHWQGLVTVLLVLYQWANKQFSTQQYATMAIAARNCSLSCSTLCSLSTSAFGPVGRNVSERAVILPANTPLTWRPRPATLRSHTTDIWWLDPATRPAYCQWGWSDQYWREPEIAHFVRQEQLAAPSYLSRRGFMLWNEYPGKYLASGTPPVGVMADGVQNWLSWEPDPAATATFWPFAIFAYSAVVQFLALPLLLVLPLWELWRVRSLPFGSLRYVLRLESARQDRCRQRLNYLYTAFAAVWLMLDIAFAGVVAQRQGGNLGIGYHVDHSAMVIQIVVSVYTLLLEYTPFPPTLEESAPSVQLPLRWWTPPSLTVAQVS
jgi:hypothetical protein